MIDPWAVFGGGAACTQRHVGSLSCFDFSNTPDRFPLQAVFLFFAMQKNKKRVKGRARIRASLANAKDDVILSK